MVLMNLWKTPRGGRVVRRASALALSALMIGSAFAGLNGADSIFAQTADAAATTDSGLADTSQEGVILH